MKNIIYYILNIIFSYIHKKNHKKFYVYKNSGRSYSKYIAFIVRHSCNEIEMYLPVLYKLKEINSNVGVIVIFLESYILKEDFKAEKLYEILWTLTDISINAKNTLENKSGIIDFDKGERGDVKNKIYKNDPKIKLYLMVWKEKIARFLETQSLKKCLLKTRTFFSAEDVIAILKDHAEEDNYNIKIIQQKFSKATIYACPHGTEVFSAPLINGKQRGIKYQYKSKLDYMFLGSALDEYAFSTLSRDKLMFSGYARFDSWWVSYLLKTSKLHHLLEQPQSKNMPIITVFLPAVTIDNLTFPKSPFFDVFLSDIRDLSVQRRDCFFIIKPHPGGGTKKNINRFFSSEDVNCQILYDYTCAELIDVADVVITIASSVELESLYRGTHVIEYSPMSLELYELGFRDNDKAYMKTFYSYYRMVSFFNDKKSLFQYVKSYIYGEVNISPYQRQFNKFFNTSNTATMKIVKTILRNAKLVCEDESDVQ